VVRDPQDAFEVGNDLVVAGEQLLGGQLATARAVGAERNVGAEINLRVVGQDLAEVNHPAHDRGVRVGRFLKITEKFATSVGS
jgi:hypothetical protein